MHVRLVSIISAAHGRCLMSVRENKEFRHFQLVSRFYLFQAKNPFLRLCVRENLKHALLISLHNAVCRLGILADVSIVSFHLASHFPYRQVLGNYKLVQTWGEVEEALEMLIKLIKIVEAYYTTASS